ncbi:MAG: glutamine--fructose-6-phosphate transaminase (isomerizing), partial [Thermoplasmatales archaeon]|nr:glutamine--fructose-6-phosphate transaminase (isomerizing) [Thermoplasmatales archaeon]
MCGIIGYMGHRAANDVIIESLKRLEYRGYDSAGIGIIGEKLQVFKEVGEIAMLQLSIPKIKGNLGIGHTRWATHGKVSKENAHPHLSCDKKIAVVHNGIIENFKTLREELENKGHIFTSQTDSEVIIHLIEEEYKGNLEQAVSSSLKKIQGSYAIVVICEDEPEKLVGARNESPLVVGVGDNENFFASDVTALLKFTNRVIYLDDGEHCVITKNSIHIFDGDNTEIQKKENTIEWDFNDAKKSGFPHFMLKEIYEQSDSVQRVLRGRVLEINRSVELPDNVERLLNDTIDSIHIVACGTSLYSGMIGKYLIEKITNIPVFVEISSEYRYFGTKDRSSLVVCMTQSGETADTLGALKKAKNAGSRTIVVTNVIGSTASRIADGFVLTQCGPEIGVAATKTFTSQMLSLLLIALKIATIRKELGSDEIYSYIRNLKDIPRQIRQVLAQSDKIADMAKHLKDATSVFFIGRGVNYPLALEGALKLKEISYIHAEGFAAGEIKHGPFALLTKDTP